jgi:hypothetical protein
MYIVKLHYTVMASATLAWSGVDVPELVLEGRLERANFWMAR